MRKTLSYEVNSISNQSIREFLIDNYLNKVKVDGGLRIVIKPHEYNYSKKALGRVLAVRELIIEKQKEEFLSDDDMILLYWQNMSLTDHEILKKMFAGKLGAIGTLIGMKVPKTFENFFKENEAENNTLFPRNPIGESQLLNGFLFNAGIELEVIQFKQKYSDYQNALLNIEHKEFLIKLLKYYFLETLLEIFKINEEIFNRCLITLEISASNVVKIVDVPRIEDVSKDVPQVDEDWPNVNIFISKKDIFKKGTSNQDAFNDNKQLGNFEKPSKKRKISASKYERKPIESTAVSKIEQELPSPEMPISYVGKGDNSDEIKGIRELISSILSEEVSYLVPDLKDFNCLELMRKLFYIREKFIKEKEKTDELIFNCYLQTFTYDEHNKIINMFIPNSGLIAIQKILVLNQNLAYLLRSRCKDEKDKFFSANPVALNLENILKNYSFEVGISKEFEEFYNDVDAGAGDKFLAFSKKEATKAQRNFCTRVIENYSESDISRKLNLLTGTVHKAGVRCLKLNKLDVDDNDTSADMLKIATSSTNAKNQKLSKSRELKKLNGYKIEDDGFLLEKQPSEHLESEQPYFLEVETNNIIAEANGVNKSDNDLVKKEFQKKSKLIFQSIYSTYKKQEEARVEQREKIKQLRAFLYEKDYELCKEKEILNIFMPQENSKEHQHLDISNLNDEIIEFKNKTSMQDKYSVGFFNNYKDDFLNKNDHLEGQGNKQTTLGLDLEYSLDFQIKENPQRNENTNRFDPYQDPYQDPDLDKDLDSVFTI